MMSRRIKAQSLVEYSVLAACIAGALISMQFYMKRAVQGRVKQAGDEIGEPYDAAATKSEITTKVNSRTTIISTPITDSVTGEISSIKSDIKQIENVTRTGTEKISAWGDGTLDSDITSSGGSSSVGGIIGSSLYSAIGGTALSGYTYTLSGGHTSAEVEAKFSELYNSNLGQRYSNTVNAVAACLGELDKLNYIDLNTK